MKPIVPSQFNDSGPLPVPTSTAQFEKWRDRPFNPGVPIDRIPVENRKYLSKAGALCHAIVMGEVRSVDPEVKKILDVACGWTEPDTKLHRSWLAYQDDCLSYDRKLHSDAELEVKAAELRWQEASELSKSYFPKALLPTRRNCFMPRLETHASGAFSTTDDLVRSLDAAASDLAKRLRVANAEARRAERDLPQLILKIESERDQLIAPIRRFIAVVEESLSKLKAEQKAASSARDDALRECSDAFNLLTRSKATNLLRPDVTAPGKQCSSSEVSKNELLESKRKVESEITRLEQRLHEIKCLIEKDEGQLDQLRSTQSKAETPFSERISEARAHADALRRESLAIENERTDFLLSVSKRLRLKVQEESQALDRARERYIDMGQRLALLDESTGSQFRKRDSFVYMHLCARKTLSRCYSGNPSFLESFDSRGTDLWQICGQSCHRDTLQLAFPGAIQSELSQTAVPNLKRWTLDATQLPECDRVRVQPLLTAMCSLLCCSTSLDAYFALDWYSEPEESTGNLGRTEVGELVYRAKYNGRRELVAKLAERLSKMISAHPLYSTARLVAAVPCLPSKQYDMPRHLCTLLAPQVKKLDASGAIHKLGPTKPMKDIDDFEEKLSNISQAFRADARSIAGDDVVLIDDTYGSGTTMWEVARTLKNAGAIRVLGITCAKNWSRR